LDHLARDIGINVLRHVGVVMNDNQPSLLEYIVIIVASIAATCWFAKYIEYIITHLEWRPS
jgi:hypothetical protein